PAIEPAGDACTAMRRRSTASCRRERRRYGGGWRGRPARSQGSVLCQVLLPRALDTVSPPSAARRERAPSEFRDKRRATRSIGNGVVTNARASNDWHRFRARCSEVGMNEPAGGGQPAQEDVNEAAQTSLNS